MIRANLFFVVAGLSLAALAANAAADPISLVQIPVSTDPPNETPRTYSNALGYDFQVGSTDLAVTALGMYSPGAVAADNVVQLYSETNLGASSGTLIASVPIAEGSTPDSTGFVYVPAVVTLLAGDDYVLMYGDSSTDPFVDVDRSNFSPYIVTSTMDAELNGTGDGFPGQHAGYAPYVGPNLEFTAVPEPATLGFLASPAISLLMARRRRTHFR